MFQRPIPALVCTLGLSFALQAGDIQSVPGHGVATAEKSMFSQEKENQKALDQAQRNATLDAMQGAVLKLLGVNHLEPGKSEAIAADLADHSGTVIRSQNVTDSRMDGLKASVSLVFRMDFGALKEYLDTKGISLTQAFEAKFKFFVLSYSIEGMDGDRSKPQVLHEEVRAESQHNAGSDFKASNSASADFQNTQAGQAVVVLPEGGGAAAAHASHTSAHGENNAQVASSSFDQGSASYFRVTDYADPTKKGMGGNAEARNLVEGALHKAHLTVATIEAPTFTREFKSEDEFVNAILAAVRKHPEAQPDDCVGIVINSLTPLAVGAGNARGHQYVSRVTAHFVRVTDGMNLIQSDSVTKKSESMDSDDEARTQATRLAVMAMTARLPEGIRDSFQRLQRMAANKPAAVAGVYTVVIQNVLDRSVLLKAKQWLKQQGFSFKSDASNGGTVETLTVALGDHAPEDFKDALDGLPASMELISKTDSDAKIRVR